MNRFINVRPKKHLGQHFLSDPRIISNIVDQLALEPTDHVIEIGPGPGIMTEQILNRGVPLTVIETDRDMVDALRQNFGDQLTIIHQDILKVNLAKTLGDKKWKIIGNLPYNISSPILFLLRNHYQQLDRAVVMLQREVAQRIIAPVGSKAYGILAISMQIIADCQMAFSVKPGAFFPPPKVHSAVLRLKFLENARFGVDNLENFKKLVDAAFNQRRKTIKNSLMNRYWQGSVVELEAVLERSGISPTLRPEAVPIEKWASLYRQFVEL